MDWHSTRLSFTAVSVHTIADEQRRDRTVTPRWSVGSLGFWLLVLAFPLLATGQGRAVLCLQAFYLGICAMRCGREAWPTAKAASQACPPDPGEAFAISRARD